MNWNRSVIASTCLQGIGHLLGALVWRTCKRCTWTIPLAISPAVQIVRLDRILAKPIEHGKVQQSMPDDLPAGEIEDQHHEDVAIVRVDQDVLISPVRRPVNVGDLAR